MTPAIRRLVLVVDIEGYSAHDNTVQLRMQERLHAVLRAGLSSAGVARRRTEQQDSGDGTLIVLPAGLDEARAVPGLLRGLLRALERDGESPRLRLRAALGQGVVHQAATGFVGVAVVTACRLVDAGEVRAELRAVPGADLCLIVTDDLYRDVVSQGYGGVSGDGYRTLVVEHPGKEFRARAWMRALSAAMLPPDAAAATAFAAMPLVAAASAMLPQVIAASGDGHGAHIDGDDPQFGDDPDDDPVDPPDHDPDVDADLHDHDGDGWP